MKIRQGFVSNSSSSSFCIYGVAFENVWDSLKDEWKQKLKDSIEEDESEEEDDEENYPYEDDPYEFMSELCRLANITKGFLIEAPDGYDCVYIGNSWSNIEDDQTGRQFKDDIENRMKILFNIDQNEFGTHQEAYYA